MVEILWISLTIVLSFLGMFIFIYISEKRDTEERLKMYRKRLEKKFLKGV